VATHTYNGLTQVANLHFAAAIPEHVRGYVEWDANAVNAFRDELVTPTVDVTDGVLTVPSGPGLGVELDPEVLDRLEFIEGPEILGVPRRRSWAPGG
jgi:D-galactarolactone cycloisomerase